MKSKTEKWPPKVRQKKKIYNFWDVNSKFVVQVFYTQKPQYINFAAKNQPFSNIFLKWNLDHSHWLNFFLQNCIFMRQYFFTFSAISHELSKLQSSRIWQNKRLYLTNLIYFMIHDKKRTENRLKRAIYQSQICLFTLYFHTTNFSGFY